MRINYRLSQCFSTFSLERNPLERLDCSQNPCSDTRVCSIDIDGKYLGLLKLFNRVSMVISALFLFSYWPLAEPLPGAHGTLRFRGTPVEKHSATFISIDKMSFNK